MTDGARSSQAPVMANAPATASPARAGEIAAFRAIFDGEFDYLWHSLRRLGVQSRDLEDVTHDVFIEVHRQLHRYDPSRPMRPWLFAFAFRFASDYRRLARHRVEVFDEHDEPRAQAPLADEALEDSEARAFVAAALEQIEMPRRAVFILHELDEVPMNEIAESLGVPLNTAYSRLRVARQEFTAASRRLLLKRGAR
jgi:RNA polymerase sigma-70 factor (ECF subfamily)